MNKLSTISNRLFRSGFIFKTYNCKVYRNVSTAKTQSSEKEVDNGRHAFEESVKSTVDKNDVDLHSSLRDEWWDENGTMRGLHALNQLRVPFIRNGLLETSQEFGQNINTAKPLKGAKILEVGCGGGILTQRLAKIGASVTGLDASKDLVTLAESRKPSDCDLNYVNDTIEEYCKKHVESFDAVVASEVIEHVTEKELFLESCIKCLRRSGSIFITTINKTSLAYFGGVWAAENVFRIVPSGTHDWEKFISPEELARLLEKYGCKTNMIHGMCYNVFTNEWSWTSKTSINYAVQAIKKSL